MELTEVKAVFKHKVEGGAYLTGGMNEIAIVYQVGLGHGDEGRIETIVLVGCGMLFLRGLSLNMEDAKVDFYERVGKKWKLIESLVSNDDWRKMVDDDNEREGDGGVYR